MGSSGNGKKEPKNIVLYGFLIVLFAPIALVYGLALVGVDSPRLLSKIPAFGTWFMFSLAMCGVFVFVNMLVEGVKNRRVEWGCLVVVGGVTALWLSILWKQLT